MSYIGKTPTAVPLTSSDITDGIITTAKIVDANITTAKILNSNVTTAKIADDAVTTDKLANSINSAITANTAKVTNATHSGDVTGATALTIADNAVTLAKMASGTDGNIISYDTSGNPVAVATGSSGQILTSAGAGAVPSFQTAAGGGKILQVLQTVKTDSFSTTSTSFTDITGMTRAITPSASDSKIMIFINLTASATGSTNMVTRFLLLRNTTAIALPSATGSQYGSFVDQRYVGNDSRNISFHFLDSPSTTSAVTYKLQMTRGSDGTTVQIGNRLEDNLQETPAIFTVMEVGA